MLQTVAAYMAGEATLAVLLAAVGAFLLLAIGMTDWGKEAKAIQAKADERVFAGLDSDPGEDMQPGRTDWDGE